MTIGSPPVPSGEENDSDRKGAQAAARSSSRARSRALRVSATPAPGGTEIRQTAVFDASGLFGLAYWYALYPLHRFVFAGMLRRIADRALASAV